MGFFDRIRCRIGLSHNCEGCLCLFCDMEIEFNELSEEEIEENGTL